MKLNRKWLLAIALVLSLTMATAGTLAYLTDTQTVDNVFTMGKVDISLDESEWVDGSDLLPGVPVLKNPEITNEARTPAWVWLEVHIPEALYPHLALDYQSGWDMGSYPPKNENGMTIVTMLYESLLTEGQTTNAAFTQVELSALLDNDDMETLIGSDTTVITVKAYAIQDQPFTSTNEAYEAYQANGQLPTIEVDNAQALQDMLNDGNNVKLTADINMNGKAIQIPEGSDLEIDLNGKTLTSKDGGEGNWMAIKVNRNATLHLKDSAGNGKLVSSCYGIYVQPNATFIMDGGEIEVSGNGVHDIGVTVWNGTFVMNDGTINAKYGVVTSNHWRNTGEECRDCEVEIKAGCEINGTDSDIDVVDAPDTILTLPATNDFVIVRPENP